MATATINACQICANAFNSDFYQSVSLPCGHAFCLLCVVRLKASGNSKCPTCHSSWAGVNVPALEGLEALLGALQVDREEENLLKKKVSGDHCEKHSMPYDFWVSVAEEFYCSGCAAENPHVKLELIENSIPQVKAALARKVPIVEVEMKSHLQSLDEMHAEFVSKRNCVVQFMKAVQTLNDNLNQNIDQIVVFKSQLLETAADLQKLDRTIDSIETTADLHVAVECNSTLKKIGVRFSPPVPDLSQALLCKIIYNYVGEAGTVNAPFMTPLVSAVLKGNPVPLQEVVRASQKLRHGQNWTVDNNNCDAVRLALADNQPTLLRLIERDDGHEALPVAALVKAVKYCVVRAKFVDTFYSAKDTTVDTKRLKHLLSNESVRLERFYGHLDHSAIAELPHTVIELGLAIGSAADAAAVCGLTPWEKLCCIDVSVSSRVAVRDLNPMPNVPLKGLYFPFLTDANVDHVRPAIDVLVPDHRMESLSFPKCLLTVSGVRRLAHHLRGVKVVVNVTIEATSSWRPDSQEQAILNNELRSGEMGELKWNMHWFYH